MYHDVVLFAKLLLEVRVELPRWMMCEVQLDLTSRSLQDMKKLALFDGIAYSYLL